MCQQKNSNQPARHPHARWTHHIFIPYSITSSRHSPHWSTTCTHFPWLKKKALLSIGMFCDNGCLALFCDKKVYIIKKRTNKNIMHGTRDNKSSLYMIPLTPEQNENMTECKIPERYFAGSLYEAKSKLTCVLSPPRGVEPMHINIYQCNEKHFSPLGQESPNNLSKIPTKIQGNSKRAHSEIIQGKTINKSQGTQWNVKWKPNAHAQCFFSGNWFIGKSLHRSNRPITRHIKPWF